MSETQTKRDSACFPGSGAGELRLKQRSDYTHKHNVRLGRHGWLRLTPAYSRKLVEEILLASDPAARVLDPFSRTGTTALCAANSGRDAVSIDVNPFLVWFGRAKVARYSDGEVELAREAGRLALKLIRRGDIQPSAPPPIYDIERWWGAKALSFLCALKGAIEQLTAASETAEALLKIAFCRSLIKLSNAAFNHQSMSFKDGRQASMFEGQGNDEAFSEDLSFVLESAQENPTGHATVVQADSVDLRSAQLGYFDLVITSPPYPNRMSYIRELRPYMYWLGFLTNSRHAGELDWASVGGTWGCATSRLKEWKSGHTGPLHPYLQEILAEIADRRNPNGVLLSNYVAKYFEDMFRHLANLRTILKESARLHYIVGNSTFYGVLLPVERLYADMLEELHFSDIHLGRAFGASPR